MSVWLIPAAGNGADKNYSKTLSRKISDERKKNFPNAFLDLKVENYAWGFPINKENLENYRKMQEGDLCFFYTKRDDGSPNAYYWVAKVSKKPELDVDSIDEIPWTTMELSYALWDDRIFLPYFLEAPTSIYITTAEFGASLGKTIKSAKGTSFLSSHPQSPILFNPTHERLLDFDSIYPGGEAEWVEELLKKCPKRPDYKDLSKKIITQVSKEDLFNTGNLLRRNKRSQLQSKSKPINKTINATSTVEIGNAGEKLVFNMLQKRCKSGEISNLKNTAADKCGWDIEYKDCTTKNMVYVEVKSTKASSFSSFNITANEWLAAKEKKEAYKIYLVNNVSTQAESKYQIIENPYEVFKEFITPTAYEVVCT